MVLTRCRCPNSTSLQISFKRGYVYVNRLPKVLAQLPGWFTDYNEIHPHKGLDMRSSREYLRAVS